MRRLSPRRAPPLPVPLLRFDVGLRSGKGRAAGRSVHARWWRLHGGHDEDGRQRERSGAHTRLAAESLKGQSHVFKGPVACLNETASHRALGSRSFCRQPL